MVYYPKKGHYSCHHDSSALSIDAGKIRLLTVGVFLNDVPVGGETVFPAVGLADQHQWGEVEWDVFEDWECPRRCSAKEGLAIKPLRGDAVFWYNVRPDAFSRAHSAVARNDTQG